MESFFSDKDGDRRTPPKKEVDPTKSNKKQSASRLTRKKNAKAMM